MKKIISLFLLLAAVFLGACATTSKQSTEGEDGQAAAEPRSSSGSPLLMDRYKSGEIPGYRE